MKRVSMTRTLAAVAALAAATSVTGCVKLPDFKAEPPAVDVPVPAAPAVKPGEPLAIGAVPVVALRLRGISGLDDVGGQSRRS